MNTLLQIRLYEFVVKKLSETKATWLSGNTLFLIDYKIGVQFKLSFFPLLAEMNASDLLGFQNLIGLISAKVNLSGFKNLIGYHPRQIELHTKTVIFLEQTNFFVLLLFLKYSLNHHQKNGSSNH